MGSRRLRRDDLVGSPRLAPLSPPQGPLFRGPFHSSYAIKDDLGPCALGHDTPYKGWRGETERVPVMTVMLTKIATWKAAWNAFWTDLCWTDEDGNGPEAKLYGI